MSKTSVKQLLERLQRSRLVPRAALREHLLAYQQQCAGTLPNDAADVATHLVQVRALTRWQADKLLAGKSKGFYVGRFKILEHIGSGGMSSVYRAEDTSCGDCRAIKVFPKSRLDQSSYLERFYLEAAAIASLDHPNIVRAFGLEQRDDLHYLVMELVPGRDLQVLVHEDGPLEFAAAASCIAQAAAGLHHAHQQGLIHRDVKPANLMVDERGIVKVLDLGLALYKDEADSLTIASGEKVLGTADYLAPEQARDSHGVDRRADIYGLGCTLYFALTGQPPFAQGSVAQRILAHQSRRPDPPQRARRDCPRELNAICMRMLEKRPKDRFQSCLEVVQVLRWWMGHSRVEQIAAPGAVAVGGRSTAEAAEPHARPAARRAPPPTRGSHDTVSNRQTETRVSRKRAPASIGPHSMPITRPTTQAVVASTPPETGMAEKGRAARTRRARVIIVAIAVVAIAVWLAVHLIT